MIRPFSASYECGRRLMAAGIPLDYPSSLPREVDALRNHLYIGELGGDVRSFVMNFKKEERIGYLIALRLATNLSRGIVIADWNIKTPWDHHINWEHDPADIVPVFEHSMYERLFNSHLSDVLNQRRHLAAGRPVEGLLCGCTSFESIPSAIRTGATVGVQLTLTDDTGRTCGLEVGLTVRRSVREKMTYARREGRLFEKQKVVKLEAKKSAAKKPEDQDINRTRQLLDDTMRKILDQRVPAAASDSRKKRDRRARRLQKNSGLPIQRSNRSRSAGA